MYIQSAIIIIALLYLLIITYEYNVYCWTIDVVERRKLLNNLTISFDRSHRNLTMTVYVIALKYIFI